MPKGTVKWFNTETGQGFIKPDQNGARDIFVDAIAVREAGLSALSEGQKVQFEIIEDKRSAHARAGNLKPC